VFFSVYVQLKKKSIPVSLKSKLDEAIKCIISLALDP
jgi:hypothetical protein